MDKLLNFKYYFDTNPGNNFQFTKVILAIVALFYLLSLAIRIYRKRYCKNDIIRKMLRGYTGRFFTYGSILLFILLSRETGIPILSMRFWMFAFLLYVIIWILKVSLTFKKEYKKRSHHTEHHDSISKYLPKKKKKK
jgi:hypothetical protein